MPRNKNQIARFLEINECLRSKGKKYWTKEELIERILENRDIRIEERTLDQDIYDMRYNEQLNYLAPIKYSKKEKGYYYTDPHYSIDNLPLNEKDIQALEFATTTLRQYRNVKLFNDFTGAVDKLINVVNHIKNTNHHAHFNFVEFEKAPYIRGFNFMDTLIGAISQQKVVHIVYQKFEDIAPKAHMVSPLLLKEYRNRWYLLGTHHTRKKVVTLALDRMIRIDEDNEDEFITQIDFDSETYFKHTIGITYTGEPPEEVVLSFAPKQGKYIKTQFLHETQKILVDNEEELRISLLLVPNYELQSVILSYGADVCVMQPDKLKNKISSFLKNAHSQYNY